MSSSSLHKIKLVWQNETNKLDYDTYSRSHNITYEGGITVNASAAAEYRGNKLEVNPEEQLLAAVSSCHMLTFLALASRKRLLVKSYTDDAIGTLAVNLQNRMAITHVKLNPVILFEGNQPNTELIKELHHRAHLECFIANSVNFKIEVVGLVS